MKIAVVYHSSHHGNTKKVLDDLAAAFPLTLIDAAADPRPDLSGYDLIGFASGIYYSKFHKDVLQAAREALPAGKPVFFLYTCGAPRKGYTAAIAQIAEEKQARVLGEYGCLGFNTYGPFKLIGGMAKGHPDQGALDRAAAFLAGLLG